MKQKKSCYITLAFSLSQFWGACCYGYLPTLSAVMNHILGSTTSAVLQCTIWQICCSQRRQVKLFPQMDSTLPRPRQLFSRLRCLFLDNTKAQKSICPERLNTHMLSWHLESVGGKGGCWENSCSRKPQTWISKHCISSHWLVFIWIQFIISVYRMLLVYRSVVLRNASQCLFLIIV